MNNETFSVRVKSLVYHHELKSLRERFGFTQNEVAEKCNMSTSYYGEIELLKRFPTEEQAVAIADLFEMDPLELFPKWTMPAYYSTQKIADRVVEIQRVSIDAPEVRLLASPPDLEETVDKSLLHDRMADLLETLTPREKRILEMRFGLSKKEDEETKEMTYEEVGREFGVTRERIRQIEAKALRKLRHPIRSSGLREFWPTEQNQEWLKKHKEETLNNLERRI